MPFSAHRDPIGLDAASRTNASWMRMWMLGSAGMAERTMRLRTQRTPLMPSTTRSAARRWNSRSTDPSRATVADGGEAFRVTIEVSGQRDRAVADRHADVCRVHGVVPTELGDDVVLLRVVANPCAAHTASGVYSTVMSGTFGTASCEGRVRTLAR